MTGSEQNQVAYTFMALQRSNVLTLEDVRNRAEPITQRQRSYSGSELDKGENHCSISQHIVMCTFLKRHPMLTIFTVVDQFQQICIVGPRQRFASDN